MKQLLFVTLAASFLLFSCGENGELKLDLSELDDVTLQQLRDSASVAERNAEIAAQIDKLNEAGEFFTFNLKILDNIDPVEGATVKLTAGAGGQSTVRENVSDNNGDVFFDGVSLGGNIIEIAAENYYSVIGIVEFNFVEGVNYEVIDGVVIPIVRNESAIVPLFPDSVTSDNFATIKGRAQIETNLINEEAEVPVGAVIRVNFTGNIIKTSEGFNFQSYGLNSGGGVGEAIVQSDGSYELKVPVAIDGSDIYLEYLPYETNQILVIEEDGIIKVDTVNASFGPDVISRNPVPSAPGVKVEFSDPLPEGSGLKIVDLEPTGAPLFLPEVLYPTNTSSSYRLTTGKNYQTSPELIADDPTGSDFQADVFLAFAVAEILMIDSGLYNPGDFVGMQVLVKTQNSPSTSLLSEGFNASDSGTIDQQIINRLIDFQQRAGRRGWGENYTVLNSPLDSIWVEFSSSFRSEGRPATASIVINSEINEVRIFDLGDDYVDPTFTLEGGNPDEDAILEILDYQTYWSFTIDNSGIESPYFLPPTVYFEVLRGTDIQTEIYFRDRISGKEGLFNEFYTVDTNGDIVQIDEEAVITTEFRSFEKPTAYVEAQNHFKPEGFVLLNENGSVSYLYFFNNETFSSNYGNGYAEKFSISIVNTMDIFDGSGAEVRIRAGSRFGLEYQWQGSYILDNPGSGYRQNANGILNTASYNYYEFLTSINGRFLTLKKGDVATVNISYGIGRRSDF